MHVECHHVDTVPHMDTMLLSWLGLLNSIHSRYLRDLVVDGAQISFGTGGGYSRRPITHRAEEREVEAGDLAASRAAFAAAARYTYGHIS